MGALDGVTVVDFSRVLAGPYCTMLLADLGANVIKIEAPGVGDLSREMEPDLGDKMSGAFLMVNRNKKSLAVDLKCDEGRDIIDRLLAEADVVVENFRPGVMKKFGLDADSVLEKFSRIVYCSISGFGQTGPDSERGGFDLIAQGMSGLMSITGEPGGPPVKCGIPVTDLGAGLFAVYGILGALYERATSGKGQYVDTSLFEAGLGLAVWEFTEYMYQGRVPQPTGSAHRLGAPYQAFRCSDGYVTVGADSERLWSRFCEAIGVPHLANDHRFSTNSDRMSSLPELEKEINAVFASRTREEWLSVLDDAGIPAGPINEIPEAFSERQASARGMTLELDHPDLGVRPLIGPVVKFSRTPASVVRPAPHLGQDTEAILSTLGYESDAIKRLVDRHVVARHK